MQPFQAMRPNARLRFWLPACLLFLAAATTGLRAAGTFMVTNANDSGEGSLRAALALANSGSGKNTILFDPALDGATIELSTTASGNPDSLLVLAPYATVDIDATLGLTHGITLTNAANKPARFFAVTLSNGGFNLTGLTFSGGGRGENLGNWANRSGGALSIAGGQPVLKQCVFANNTTNVDSGGGAIFFSSVNNAEHRSSLTLQDCSFTGNKSGKGGAIFASSGDLTMIGCSFTSNTGAGGGGAVHHLTGTAIAGRCTFTGNTGTQGGAVYHSTDDLTVSVTVFTGNKAGTGGAIFKNLGRIDLSYCTFTLQTADSFGGGVYSSDAEAKIGYCTFADNFAGAGGGGGICVAGAIPGGKGSAEVTCCTLARNRAGMGLTGPHAAGGAICVTSSTAKLTHFTLSQNVANDVGGGLMAGDFSHVTLLNSIIAGNTSGNGSANQDVCNSGALTLAGTSIIEVAVLNINDSSGGAGTVSGSGTLLRADAKLGPLQDNGGVTQTMLPQPGSPAIDQAPTLSSIPYSDQRGLPRIIGAHADIGAVETNTIIIVNTPVDELNGLPSDGYGNGNGVSLREALRDIAADGTIFFDTSVFGPTAPGGQVITTTLGPLNARHDCTLDATANGGLRIVQTPTFVTQPQSLALPAGSTATFNCNVVNVSGGLTLQWRVDTLRTSNSGQPVLNPPGPPAAFTFRLGDKYDEGIVDCLIGEASSGSITLAEVSLEPFAGVSRPATVVVGWAVPVIARQPAPTTLIPLGGKATLEVVAYGPPGQALKYQWCRNGANLPGATASTLALAGVKLTQAGAYTCALTCDGTRMISETAQVGVVNTAPKTTTLAAGDRYAVKVDAAGNDLGYEWRKDDELRPETGPGLAILHALPDDEGYYTCTVYLGSATLAVKNRLNVSLRLPAFNPSQRMADAAIGQVYSWQIQQPAYTPNSAVTGYALLDSLPPGLRLDPATGLISGRVSGTGRGRTSPGAPSVYESTIRVRISGFVANAGLKGGTTITLALKVLQPPSSLVGTFMGIARQDPLNGGQGARLDLATTVTGTFSGSLSLGTRPRLPFVNQLLYNTGTADGIWRGAITGLKAADGTPLTAVLEIAPGTGATLTLIHPGGSQLVINARRNPWSTAHPCPVRSFAAALDLYNTFGPLSPSAIGDGGFYPQGMGFTTFATNARGTLTFAGLLPDGAALTTSSFIDEDGNIPVFQVLYTVKGSLVGGLAFNTGTNTFQAPGAIDGGLEWSKPAQPASSRPTVSGEAYTNFLLGVGGREVTPRTAGSLLLDAQPAPAGTANCTLQLGFGMTGLFEQPVNLASAGPQSLDNTATLLPPVVNHTTLTQFNSTTGAFAGTFTRPGLLPTSFRGLIVQAPAVVNNAHSFVSVGCGFFLSPVNPLGPSSAPKYSGRAALTSP